MLECLKNCFAAAFCAIFTTLFKMYRYNIDKILIFKDGIELTFGYTVHHTPQT